MAGFVLLSNFTVFPVTLAKRKDRWEIVFIKLQQLSRTLGVLFDTSYES